MTSTLRTMAFGLISALWSLAVTYVTVGFPTDTRQDILKAICLGFLAGCAGAAAYRTDPEKAWSRLKGGDIKQLPLAVLLAGGIGLALLAGGCASTQKDASEEDPDVKDALHQFVATDAIAACRIATKRADPEGQQCFCGIQKLIEAQTTADPILEKPVGVMSTLADARAIRLGITGSKPLLKQINLACAALVGDQLVTFGRIAAMLGIRTAIPAVNVLPPVVP